MALDAWRGWSGCLVGLDVGSYCSHSPVSLWGVCVCLGAMGIGEDTVRVLHMSRVWTPKGHRRLLGSCAGLTLAHLEGT